MLSFLKDLDPFACSGGFVYVIIYGCIEILSKSEYDKSSAAAAKISKTNTFSYAGSNQKYLSSTAPPYIYLISLFQSICFIIVSTVEL